MARSLAALALVAHVTAASPAGDDQEPARSLALRLGKVPMMVLAHRAPISDQQAARIRGWISDLAAVESADFGLSGTLDGDAFSPVPGMTATRAFVLTNHGLKTSSALRQLVAAGPETLPFLLAALGDKRPTKLCLEHSGGFGAMWLSDEIWGNPASPTESRIIGEWHPFENAAFRGRRPQPFKEKLVDSYTVKVGDMCFVALGQIVGRPYRAVRYQPTANIVVNSPTEDGDLRRVVRAIWASDQPSQRLLESLLADYCTECVWSGGKMPEGWHMAADLHAAAAMRLLFYFPRETADMIARRVRRLRVERIGPGAGSMHTPDEMAAWERREMANGTRVDALVKAVAWCREPVIQEAVRAVFERTDDVDIFLASLPAADKLDAVTLQRRFGGLLDEADRREDGAYGDGYNLLEAAGRRLGPASRPLFDQYLKVATPLRCYSVCQVLQKTNREQSAELLRPFLTDRRPISGYSHVVSKGDNEHSIPIRVCDAAADTLSQNYREFAFDIVGTPQDLDRQIDVVRRRLATDKLTLR